MGIVWEPRVRGTSAFGSHYQATGKALKLNSMAWVHKRTIPTGKAHRLKRLSAWCSELQSVWISDRPIVVVTVCKWSLNPITNPNPICSHSYAWQYNTQGNWKFINIKLRPMKRLKAVVLIETQWHIALQYVSAALPYSNILRWMSHIVQLVGQKLILGGWLAPWK
jgi:hypothetical protein